MGEQAEEQKDAAERQKKGLPARTEREVVSARTFMDRRAAQGGQGSPFKRTEVSQ